MWFVLFKFVIKVAFCQHPILGKFTVLLIFGLVLLRDVVSSAHLAEFFEFFLNELTAEPVEVSECLVLQILDRKILVSVVQL